MKVDQFLKLMEFSPLWQELGMVDADNMSECIASYQPGGEDSSEHDRHGLFQFWLKRKPTPETLLKLVRLSMSARTRKWLQPSAPISCDQSAVTLK